MEDEEQNRVGNTVPVVTRYEQHHHHGVVAVEDLKKHKDEEYRPGYYET